MTQVPPNPGNYINGYIKTVIILLIILIIALFLYNFYFLYSIVNIISSESTKTVLSCEKLAYLHYATFNNISLISSLLVGSALLIIGYFLISKNFQIQEHIFSSFIEEINKFNDSIPQEDKDAKTSIALLTRIDQKLNNQFNALSILQLSLPGIVCFVIAGILVFASLKSSSNFPFTINTAEKLPKQSSDATKDAQKPGDKKPKEGPKQDNEVTNNTPTNE